MENWAQVGKGKTSLGTLQVRRAAYIHELLKENLATYENAEDMTPQLLIGNGRANSRGKASRCPDATHKHTPQFELFDVLQSIDLFKNKQAATIEL